MRCLEHNQKCIKRVFVAAIADCEEGNKAAFCSLKDEIEQNRINPEFALLTPIPDAPHVRKSLKAGFSNWCVKLGNEKSNIAVIRSLRNKSTLKVQTEIRKYLPKNDYVRNRDRQDPSSALALTRKPLLNFISSLGATSITLIPETTKFTYDNMKRMYKSPVAVCIGEYGWIYILYNYDNKNRESDVMKARLDAPVDKA